MRCIPQAWSSSAQPLSQKTYRNVTDRHRSGAGELHMCSWDPSQRIKCNGSPRVWGIENRPSWDYGKYISACLILAYWIIDPRKKRRTTVKGHHRDNQQATVSDILCMRTVAVPGRGTEKWLLNSWYYWYAWILNQNRYQHNLGMWISGTLSNKSEVKRQSEIENHETVHDIGANPRKALL
jgi:hypothetical protein